MAGVRRALVWTITGVHPDGALTVTPIKGHGQVALPADYVREHVRLGYAATEHGAQGDTVDVGIHLATETSTRRNLYVGATRGRSANHLQRILTTDRADLPATTICRALAADQGPHRRVPIPVWIDDARHELVERKAVALEREGAAATRLGRAGHGNTARCRILVGGVRSQSGTLGS